MPGSSSTPRCSNGSSTDRLAAPVVACPCGPVVEIFRADRLVACAGAWSASVLEGLGLPLRVERHALHWFAPSGDTAPFRLGRLPVYLWEFVEGSELYGFPLLPGAPGAKVAFFHHGRPADPDHLDREVDDR